MVINYDKNKEKYEENDIKRYKPKWIKNDIIAYKHKGSEIKRKKGLINC